MKHTDLDTTVDEHTWIVDHPIYCPVPGCNAYQLRHALCGDPAGDYTGIHIGRLRAVERERQRTAREVAALREAGSPDPELTLGLSRLIQDAVDQGTVKGRRGRRGLVPRTKP